MTKKKQKEKRDCEKSDEWKERERKGMGAAQLVNRQNETQTI